MSTLTDINNNIQLLTAAVNNLSQTVAAAFPQAGGSLSDSATGGADTLPANPAKFLTVVVGSTSYKTPLYLP